MKACAILVGLSVVQPASAATETDRAQAIVKAFRDVTGGDAWDRLGGCYEQGTHADGAIGYQTWFSLMRYGIRMESRRGDGPARTSGFNGSASWRSNPAGDVDVRRDAASLKDALTTAYLSGNGFFFPAHFPAKFTYLRADELGEQPFDVVEITPRGGNALDYWFERRSHLLLRIVDRHSITPTIVEASDYRAAGEVRVAFGLTVTDASGRLLDRGAVKSLTCHPSDRCCSTRRRGRTRPRSSSRSRSRWRRWDW